MMDLIAKFKSGLTKNQFLPDKTLKQPSRRNAMYCTEKTGTGVTLTKKSMHVLINEIEKRGDIALKDLSDLSGLESLDLWLMVNISNIGYLRPLSKLRNLSLADTNVLDISPLSDLKNLEELSLEGTPVTNLEPLSSLQKLKILDLSRTQVIDLTPLQNLTNLEELRFDDTHRLSNISPLFNLKSLKRLSLIWTDVSEQDALKLKQHIPHTTIYFQTPKTRIYEIKL